MSKQDITKPKNIDYFQVPEALWQLLEPCLPPEPVREGPGRPPRDLERDLVPAVDRLPVEGDPSQLV